MRAEAQSTVADIQKSLELLRQRMDWKMAHHRLEEFNARVEDPTLWDDPEKAQKLMRDRQNILDKIATVTGIEQELSDNIELIEMGEAEGDQSVVEEAEAALKALGVAAAEKELEALLNGEADANDSFLEVNAGAGGTESCDWASILARMYVRWAEKKGYKVDMQSVSYGEEAGIKSVVYKITGHNAYGWLKSESGVHRLVRITHHPTGIVVTSSEKSQHQNRDIAMKALKSRLYQMELDRRNADINAAHEAKGDAGWGNQIRSYVLQPYQMVKDLRTGYETSDTKGVLDGDLDGFMAATLAMDVSGKSRAEALGED